MKTSQRVLAEKFVCRALLINQISQKLTTKHDALTKRAITVHLKEKYILRLKPTILESSSSFGSDVADDDTDVFLLMLMLNAEVISITDLFSGKDAKVAKTPSSKEVGKGKVMRSISGEHSSTKLYRRRRG